MRSLYEILAWVAVVLLVVPLVTLGGAAARLGVARRDARLATLRLLGATPARGGRPDRRRDRVAGARRRGPRHPALRRAAAAVRAAAVPGHHVQRRRAVGRVAGARDRARRRCRSWPRCPVRCRCGASRVSPLGVARRETPKKMTWLRVVVAVVGIGTFMVVSAVAGALGAAAVAALLGAMAVGFATLNAVGPWVLGLVGKVQLRRATTPARLLAARRLLDDPKAAWRVVGGLGLAGFVAGALAVLPSIDRGRHVAGPAGRDPHGRPGDRCDGDAGRRVPARGRVRGHRAGRVRARPAPGDRAAEPRRDARRAARLRPPAHRAGAAAVRRASGRR